MDGVHWRQVTDLGGDAGLLADEERFAVGADGAAQGIVAFEDGAEGGEQVGFAEVAAQMEREALVEGTVGFVVESGGQEDFALRLGEGHAGLAWLCRESLRSAVAVRPAKVAGHHAGGLHFDDRVTESLLRSRRMSASVWAVVRKQG